MDGEGDGGLSTGEGRFYGLAMVRSERCPLEICPPAPHSSSEFQTVPVSEQMWQGF